METLPQVLLVWMMEDTSLQGLILSQYNHQPLYHRLLTVSLMKIRASEVKAKTGIHFPILQTHLQVDQEKFLLQPRTNQAGEACPPIGLVPNDQKIQKTKQNTATQLLAVCMFSPIEFLLLTPIPQLEQEFETTSSSQRYKHVTKIPNPPGIDASGNFKKISAGEVVLNWKPVATLLQNKVLASHTAALQQTGTTVGNMHEVFGAMRERLDGVHQRTNQGAETSIKKGTIRNLQKRLSNLEDGRIQHHYLEHPMEEITKVKQQIAELKEHGLSQHLRQPADPFGPTPTLQISTSPLSSTRNIFAEISARQGLVP